MYIEKIAIKNFRIFDSDGVVINFKTGINAIIGANNSGKSAVIDAMRIVLSISEYKKMLYFTLDDFHINKNGEKAKTAEFDFYLSEVPSELIDIWDPESPRKGEFHIRFRREENAKGIEKVKYELWGGKIEGNNIYGEFFEAFKISYLNALRNVETDLNASKNSKIALLIKSIYNNKTDEQQLVGKFSKLNEDILSEENIKKAKSIINKNLLEIEKNIFNQKIDLNIVEPNFDSILSSFKSNVISKWTYITENKEFFIENLRDEKFTEFIKIEGEDLYLDIEGLLLIDLNDEVKNKLQNIKQVYYNISQNSLGYNNLIYIASVLGDMSQENEGVFSKLFLIEEPEAHLHPQLQKLLQLFFENKCKELTNCQIIYTSHSPSILSKVDLENVNILTEYNGIIKAITIQDTNLDVDDMEYMQKYLDVTKSQLLFSKGVIFVEGISEAIIISKIAEYLEKKLEDYFVEVVNINGVSFKPFINLLSLNNKESLIRGVVITDDDRCASKNDNEHYIDSSIDYNCSNLDEIVNKLKNGKQSDRCDNLDELITNSGIIIEKACKTLEYELALNNIDIMVDILKDIHKTSGIELEQYVEKAKSIEEKAALVWLFIRQRSEDKSKIAQKLLSKINKENGFVVPEYIKRAIIHVTNR